MNNKAFEIANEFDGNVLSVQYVVKFRNAIYIQVLLDR